MLRLPVLLVSLTFLLVGDLTGQHYTCQEGIMRPNLPFHFDKSCMLPDEIEIQFKDDAVVRLRDGRLSSHNDPRGLAEVVLVLGDARIERVFTRPEEDLDAELATCRKALVDAGQRPLENLNSFYRVRTAGPQDSERMINALNRLSIIVTAYPKHVIASQGDISPQTPRFQGNQHYFDAAPAGLGARPMVSVTGSRGQSGSVAHVEGAWRRDHEDLPPTSMLGAPPSGNWDSWREHGTACVGILAAERNGYGIDGFASGARRVLLSSLENGSANAISLAAAALGAGDVMSSSWVWSLAAGVHAPLDFFPAEFAAVRVAHARGIVYAFSSGNSARWLEDAVYGGRYAAGAPGSGGFIIGASEAGSLTRAWFSNYGDRVDANGWGTQVTTTGYGDAFFPAGDARQAYTHAFGGTSAAAPQVAGVIASYLGAVALQNRVVLTPEQVRADIRGSGTLLPTGQIGNRPDLAALLRLRGLPDGLLVKRPGSVGGSAMIEVSGNSSDAWWLFGSTSPASVGVNLNRPLLIDPSGAFVLGVGNLMGPGIVNYPVAIPNSTGAAGMQMALQAMLFPASGAARLSNSVELWVDPRGTAVPWGFGSSSIWHNYFAPATAVPEVGDVNGDGKDDIITFNRGGSAAIFVALSNGTSFGASALWHPYFAPEPETPRVGDFNGDGKADIATFRQGSQDVLVALSSGSSFVLQTTAWHTSIAPIGTWPAIADVNGDGRDDVVEFRRGTNPTVRVAMSTGSGFGPAAVWAGYFCANNEYPAVGDFDGDGKADIAAFRRDDGAVFVMRSNGNAFVESRRWHRFFCYATEIPGVGDFDGDGKSDAAAFLRGGNPLVYTTLSDGFSFRAGEVWHSYFAVGDEWPATGDFNGDGRDDIITFLRGASGLVYVALSR